MEREYRELPGGLAEMAHIAQSDREIQQLTRVYELPKTHELAVRVEGMKYIVYPRLKPAFETPAPTELKFVSREETPDGLVKLKYENPAVPTLDSLTQTPPEETSHNEVMDTARQVGPAPGSVVAVSDESYKASKGNAEIAVEMDSLQKKSHPELLTLAAELEVDGVNKNMSKAKIIAAIIEKRHPTAKE